ncbi:MAG: hypothetical protein WKF83_13045 [Nocardioidaceae bacterium]
MLPVIDSAKPSQPTFVDNFATSCHNGLRITTSDMTNAGGNAAALAQRGADDVEYAPIVVRFDRPSHQSSPEETHGVHVGRVEDDNHSRILMRSLEIAWLRGPGI